MNQPDTITSEVARLRIENARLRAALSRIVVAGDDPESPVGNFCSDVAREALNCERSEQVKP